MVQSSQLIVHRWDDVILVASSVHRQLSTLNFERFIGEVA